MKGEEILARMKELGTAVTLRTLQRYETAGLLPPAERGWGEGGFGRYAVYCPLAAAEFYASYSLVHRYLWKVRFEDVHAVREVALKLERFVKFLTPLKFRSHLSQVLWPSTTLLVKRKSP